MKHRFLDKSILIGLFVSILIGFFTYYLGFNDIKEKSYILFKEDNETLQKNILTDLDKYNHFLNGLKAFIATHHNLTDSDLNEYFKQINIDKSYKDLIYIKYKNNLKTNFFYFNNDSFSTEDYMYNNLDFFIVNYNINFDKNKEIIAYLNLHEILFRNINNFSRFKNLNFSILENQNQLLDLTHNKKINSKFIINSKLNINNKDYFIAIYSKEYQKYYNGEKVIIALSILSSFLFLVLWLFYNRIWSAQFIAADIAEKATNDLVKIAWFDSLTGLFNRAKCLQQIDYFIKTKKEGFHLFFIDLNGFKRVNDTLGHHAGDIILEEYAQRLKKIMPNENILARVGGDEFVILINKNDKSIFEWVELIKQATADLYILDNYKFSLSQSIGISSYPENGQDNETLLKHADIAMYQAKKSDCYDYVIYNESVGQELIERNKMESNLIDSIKNNELYLMFQPKVSFINNKYIINGAEALVRWNNPIWGEVGPDKFISIAEQNGFIDELSNWLLQNVCDTINHLKTNFKIKLPISINLSGKQFLNPSLADEIIDIIKLNNVDPSLITIEITEGTIMKQPEIAKKIISVLRYHGIKVSMDDFGTGYSSFSYLSRFMIDELKIDKSFITQLNKSSVDKSVVEAIVSMAHKLNLNVIAEGVETEQQTKFLNIIGCHNFQGFYFSKPMKFNDFLSFYLKFDRII